MERETANQKERENLIEKCIEKNEVNDSNWSYTPQYKTDAFICNHRKNCIFLPSCGHAKPHDETESCKTSCYGAGKCFDVSAIGVWP